VRRGRFVNRRIAASYRVTLYYIGIASAQLSEAPAPEGQSADR
jgi:hypothetical protein